MPAALGFLTALMISLPGAGPIFIVTSAQSLSSAGRLHGHGLNALGLDPSRVTFVTARNEMDAFWAIEEILRSGAAQIIAGLIAQSLDLKKSQRLSLAAREARRPLLLLRPPKSAVRVLPKRAGASLQLRPIAHLPEVSSAGDGR